MLDFAGWAGALSLWKKNQNYILEFSHSFLRDLITLSRYSSDEFWVFPTEMKFLWTISVVLKPFFYFFFLFLNLSNQSEFSSHLIVIFSAKTLVCPINLIWILFALLNKLLGIDKFKFGRLYCLLMLVLDDFFQQKFVKFPFSGLKNLDYCSSTGLRWKATTVIDIYSDGKIKKKWNPCFFFFKCYKIYKTVI